MRNDNMSPQVEVTLDTPSNDYATAEAVATVSLWQYALLEAIGTAFFVYISLAGVHQAVLSSLSNGSAVDEIHIAICFTLGLSTGIVFALRSGAHLNPAVSFTMWLAGNIHLGKLVVYVVSQLVGALVGSLLVLALYYSRIDTFSENGALVGSFGTLKNSANSLSSSILDQLIGSSLLMIGILKSPNSRWKPLFIGLVLGGLGLFQGSNGFAFNLARDFVPRVVSTIVYGSDPFTLENYWFWVPMVMPFVGMPLGHSVAQYL